MATATLRHLRMAPSKVRRVAKLVTGKNVEEAQRILALDSHAAAPVLKKIVQSAAANAVHNESADEDRLTVKCILVNKGKTLRRLLPRSRGRADVIRKRMSHVTIVVEEGITGS